MSSTLIHISFSKEIDPPKGVDLRTRKGRETEVLAQVRKFGGFTVFWATENLKRAHAIERLTEAGHIRRKRGGSYPWCPYKVLAARRNG